MTTANKHNQQSQDFPTFSSKSAGFILAGFSVAILVSTMILWGMYQLIKAVDVVVTPEPPGNIVDFVRLNREERVVKKPREKPKLTPPAMEPPPPQNDWKFQPNDEGLVVNPPPTVPGFESGTKIEFQSDSSNMELTVFAPMYPERARVKGVQGYCEVRFTITKTGSVTDAVVDQHNCTSRLFYASSTKAALKFKYTPRIVNGEAVQTHNVTKRFTYKLE